jgi:23S rRNA-/tRNA-specific pseudouridylate synthase
MATGTHLSADRDAAASACSPGEVFTKIYSPPSTPTPPVAPTALPPLPTAASQESVAVRSTPPYIVHVSAPRGLDPGVGGTTPTLLEFIAQYTAFSQAFLRELAAFGAVWAKVGNEHPHVSPRALRITTAGDWNRVLPPREKIYARVHATPRRHRAFRPVALLLRHSTKSGTVSFVDKPPGVPVAPSSDNLHECVLAMASCIVGEEVRITSRLDVGTSGVVALGSGRETVSLVNAALQQESCSKYYAVLTRRRPTGATLRHWVRQDAGRGSGVLTVGLVREWNDGREPEDDPGGWFVAELVIEHTEPMWEGTAWESTVRLVTGRTHQIRVQFAAEGYPVYNDRTYEVAGGDGRIVAGATLGPYAQRHGLHAAKLVVNLEGQSLAVRAGPPWWREG